MECGLQPVRGVAGVMHAVALAPAPDRLAAHAVLASQLVLTGRGLLDGRTHGRRGGGVLVQGDQQATPPGRMILPARPAAPRGPSAGLVD